MVMVAGSSQINRIASNIPQARKKVSITISIVNNQLKKCFEISAFLVKAATTIIFAGIPMDAKISTPYPIKEGFTFVTFKNQHVCLLIDAGQYLFLLAFYLPSKM